MAFSGTSKTQTASLELIDGDDHRGVAVNQLPFVIGRAEGCHLVLRQNYVSRVHAEITRRGRSSRLQTGAADTAPL